MVALGAVNVTAECKSSRKIYENLEELKFQFLSKLLQDYRYEVKKPTKHPPPPPNTLTLASRVCPGPHSPRYTSGKCPYQIISRITLHLHQPCRRCWLYCTVGDRVPVTVQRWNLVWLLSCKLYCTVGDYVPVTVQRWNLVWLFSCWFDCCVVVK